MFFSTLFCSYLSLAITSILILNTYTNIKGETDTTIICNRLESV